MGRLGIWLLSQELNNRYWNVFGTEEPHEGAALSRWHLGLSRSWLRSLRLVRSPLPS